MIGLALDGGRFILFHNNLQDLADAAALAGAADLGTSYAGNAAADAQAMANNNCPLHTPITIAVRIGGMSPVLKTFP